jgi:hypothetical protein
MDCRFMGGTPLTGFPCLLSSRLSRVNPRLLHWRNQGSIFVLDQEDKEFCGL